MEHRSLAIHIAKSITDGSNSYHAHLSKEPRLYISLSGDRLNMNMRHGIEIRKYPNVYWITPRVFIFIPDIVKYVKLEAKKDSSFAERARSLKLSNNDIEKMVNILTHDAIRLYLKVRK